MAQAVLVHIKQGWIQKFIILACKYITPLWTTLLGVTVIFFNCSLNAFILFLSLSDDDTLLSLGEPVMLLVDSGGGGSIDGIE